MNYKWLWFDLDNTILNFSKSADLAFDLLMEELGIENTTSKKVLYDKINHSCWVKFENNILSLEEIKTTRFQKLFTNIGFDFDGYKANDMYLQHIGANPFLIDYATELIEYCHGKGYKLAILTNGMTLAQAPRLEKLDLLKYFDHLFVSESIKVAKPALGYFNHCYERCHPGSKDEILIVGDSLSSDIKGANNFGSDCVWYNPNNKKGASDYRIKHEIKSLKELESIL